MSMGCGPGSSCCGNCRNEVGLGDAPTPRYPHIEAALKNWIDGQNAAGRDWYISAELNSDLYRNDTGFGFIGPLIASIGAVAAKIGPAVVKGAEIVGMAKATGALKGGGGSSSGVTSDDIAAAVTPQVVAALAAQGVTLPPAAAQQVTQAGLNDIFGVNTKPLLIAAAVGVAALLLFRRR